MRDRARQNERGAGIRRCQRRSSHAGVLLADAPAGAGAATSRFVELANRSAGEGKKRPGFDRARRMIRADEATGLVVSKLDRCSRSERTSPTCSPSCRSTKPTSSASNESFDTSSGIGEAMIYMTMVFAQLERRRTSERVIDWHRYNAGLGRHHSKPVTGYRREGSKRDARIVLDEDVAPIVKEAAELFLDTDSVGDVGRFFVEHGIPMSGTAVRQIIESPTLAGVPPRTSRPRVG